MLARSGRDRYAYDGQGRLTRHTRTRISQKAETWLYEWDAQDHLTTIRTPDGTVWSYLYDALGRRVAKRRHASDGTVVESTLFAWAGGTVIEQTATGGAAGGETLAWAYQGYEPLAQVELRGGEARVDGEEASQADIDARFYSIVTDLAGAPAELVTPEGELYWHSRRTIWGAGDEEAPTPLRFAGQYADAESGLHYNHHRYYDPGTGRYLSQDPLGLAPAPNPNTYVHNPTTWSDPAGLQGSECRIVYRNLRDDEDPSRGLDAKNPDATYKPSGHVLHGSKPNWKSQFISTTRSRQVALESQWASERVVAIDLSKLDPSQIIDLSTDAGRSKHDIRGFTAINRTKSSQEVLLTGHIPTDAISWVRGGP